MERDYDDAANIGVYIAGSIADAKTIDDLRTQLASAITRAEKAEAEREKLLTAMRVIDTMPVDGCTPSVIESMLRQAKTLAYNARSPREGGPTEPKREKSDRYKAANNK